MEPTLILVVGAEQRRADMFERLPGAGSCAFKPLFEHDEVRGVDEFSVSRWLAEARHRITRLDPPPTGIISYWDFPVTEMTAILASEQGLATANLECIVDMQHKYLARTLQREVAPEAVPPFEAVDIYDEDAIANISLPYPFWIKPIRSFRSHLGFRVRSSRDLRRAVPALRQGLPRLGEPYEEMLSHVALPDAVAGVGGHWCIAEGIATGYQCTLEGWKRGGEVVVYGAVDSIRDPNRSSFARYQYPSKLPRRVQARMTTIVTKCLEQTRCSNVAFNAEFFWNRAHDRIQLLEINARCSASHFELFEYVDGASHAQVLLDLALNRRPEMPYRKGAWPVAAKCFIRAFTDAVIERLPTDADIERIERELPGTTVHLDVSEGDRLSGLTDQDPYSYEIGHIIVGGANEREIIRKFDDCRRRLGIELGEAAA